MKDFDYVIVGAGSAGCVLANRLSARGDKSVCLLEAGGNNLSPLLHVQRDGLLRSIIRSSIGLSKRNPEPQLHDRKIFWPRGKVLGGSSSINGMIYIRGVPIDFAAWVKQGPRAGHGRKFYLLQKG